MGAAISTTESNGKTKCVEYKNKACPTKRIEGEAKAKMDAAHTRMRNIGKSKACDSLAHGTWGGMAVDKANPNFGTVVRNAWDKKRGEYVAAHSKWMAEKKVFETAQKAHTEAMAAFTTAVNLEASNAHNACKNAHKQYNDLKNEVFNNVKSRKHVYIASLIIHCYVDNLKSNSAAKSCADKKRKSDTSMWNISANNLAACVSKAALQERFGPLSWKPSSKSCELKHWNERAHKEMQTKEKNTKESNAKREAAEKEKVTKEVNAKEKAAKAKLERDTKAAKEKKEKEDERKLKERNTKEAQMKENNSKEKSLKKEKSDKEKATKESQAKEKVKKEKDAKEKAAKEKAAKKKEASNKESSKKEKDAKERATKKERSDKEKVSKEKLEKEKAREEKKNKAIEKDKKEKTSKEKAEKEKAAKAAAIAKEKDDKARERKSKDDERNAKKKEQQSKEATAKSNERTDKAAAAERKKKADEKEQKRRAAGTCTVTAYEHNSYRGRDDIRYGTYGRRRGFQASSFKLSSGCQQV